MTKELYFVIPGDIETISGGYAYDRKILNGLAANGWKVHLISLPGDYPFPSPDAVFEADRKLNQIPKKSLVMMDGLALGALPGLAKKYAEKFCWVGLIHHPLADETGLAIDVAAQLRQEETQALSFMRSIIATSSTTARQLSHEYRVAHTIVHVAEPGVEPASPSRGNSDGRVRALCVGSIIPRKGQHLLVPVMERLRHFDWDIWVIGKADKEAPYVQNFLEAIREKSLNDRIVVTGPVGAGDLQHAYLEADFFVLPSFHEGYGMVLTEAVIRGLPIISTVAGAIPDTVPPAAGLLVPPGDVDALTDAVERLITDADLRSMLRDGALAAAAKLPRWKDTVARVDRVLQQAIGL